MLDGADIAPGAKELRKWAYQYAERKAFCHEYFGGRADAIMAHAKQFATDTSAGPIQSLDICMQVEAEFPGRLEEFLDKAREHPNGALVGLGQYIRYVRNFG